MSRIVNLLTFGLAGRHGHSDDNLSGKASKRRSSTPQPQRRQQNGAETADSAGGGGGGGDYSSYSSESFDVQLADSSVASAASSSQPPSPDPHEAYILPPAFATSPTSAYVAATSFSLPAPSSAASSIAPVLTGDATLDTYKEELDLLSREVDHVRGCVSAYGRAVIRMGLQATDVAAKAYDVCENADCFPPAMRLFYKTFKGWSEQAAELFAAQLEAEVMQPLRDWDEEVDGFIRELMRTNQLRLTMLDHRKRVDALFLSKCDAPKSWSDNQELELRVAKSDLEAAADHYSARCEGLVSHWRSLAMSRLSALDLLFTRLMTQQLALFQPALQALTNTASAHIPSAADTAAAGAATDAEAESTSVATTSTGPAAALTLPPAQSPVTPPTPSGRLRANSGDGTNVRKRSPEVWQEAGGEAAAVPRLHNFLTPRMQRMKRDEERRRREREREREWRRQQEPDDCGDDDDSDMDDRQEAIMRTLELMKEEMREKERLQRDMEVLMREAESRKEERGEEANRLREQLAEMEQRLAEKERIITQGQQMVDQQAADGSDNSGGVVVGADAPPPPPLDGDVPAAPPMDDGSAASDVPAAPPLAPAAPPLAPGVGFSVKKPSVREKELAEASKHRLPVLPAVVPGDVSIKRLHWSTVHTADIKGTVWEELFTLPKTAGEEAAGEGGEGAEAGGRWEAPLVKRREEDAVAVEDAEGEGGGAAVADVSPFRWQWELGDDFSHLFSQNATKPLATHRKGRKGRPKRRSGSGVSTTEQEDGQPHEDDDAEDEEGRRLRETAEAKLKRRMERVELIDAKRAYNVSISLSHFRIELPELRDAVLRMDSATLSTEMLELLLEMLPTVEEMAVVRGYSGDVELLGEVERFFLCMSVPTLSTRLKSLLFMQSFSSLTSQLQDAMELIARTNDRLRGSKPLRAVLGLVLRVGNYMTGCNGAVQAYGFHLSSLSKLRGVKSVDSKTTLLHFIVHYAHQHCPLVRNFTLDLAECRSASRVESGFLVAEVKQLQQNVRMVKQLLDDDSRRRAHQTAAAPGAAAADATSSRFSFAQPPADPTHGEADALSAVASPAHHTEPGDHTVVPAALSLVPQLSLAADLATPASQLVSSFPSSFQLPPLPDKLRVFYQYAAHRVAEMERQLAGIQQSYAALQRLFLCDELAWEGLYALLTAFVDEWQACEAEMELQRQAELRRKRQLDSQEAMQRKKREKEEAEAATRQQELLHQQQRIYQQLDMTESKQDEPLSAGAKSANSSPALQPVFSLAISTEDADSAALS